VLKSITLDTAVHKKHASFIFFIFRETLADFNKFWQAILERNLTHVSLVLATSL